MFYIPDSGRFIYPSEEELELRVGGQCNFCDVRTKTEDEEKVEASIDGKKIRIKNIWYSLGQFIMLEDETIRYKVTNLLPV